MKNRLSVVVMIGITLLTLAPGAFAGKARKAVRETDKNWDVLKEEYRQTLADLYRSEAARMRDKKHLTDTEFKGSQLQTQKGKKEAELEKVQKNLDIANKNPKSYAANAKLYQQQEASLKAEIEQIQSEIKANEDTLTRLKSLEVNPEKEKEKEAEEAERANRAYEDLLAAAGDACSLLSGNQKKSINRGVKLQSEICGNGPKGVAEKLKREAFQKVQAEVSGEGIRLDSNKVSNPVASPATPVASSTAPVASSTAPVASSTAPVASSTAPVASPATTAASGSGEQDTCDEAKMKVVQLLLKDGNSQIFAKMVELTELKMVLLLSSSSDSKDKTGDSRTLEGWLKSRNEHFSKAKENDFKDQLNTLYNSFGRSVDQGKIDKVIAKISEGKQEYWKARLDNESASAMLLYLSKYNIEGAPKIEASDAATIWALQKIRENNGTHSVNLKKAVQQGKLNFTTRVCQKLGSPKCLGQAETFVLNESKIKEMQNTREEREKELTKAIENAVSKIKEDSKYLDCFMKCNTDEKWPAMIQDVKFKLAAFIAKGDAQVGSETLEIDPTKTIGFDEKGNENLTLFFKQK